MRNLKIKVQTKTLLEFLNKHYDEYKRQYVKGLELFFNQMLSEIQNKQTQIEQKNVDIILHFKATKPEDISRKYEDSINMLEMHNDEFIEIDHEDYNAFVNDEWHWNRNFKAYVATNNLG